MNKEKHWALMPARNGANLTKKSVESLQRQTLENVWVWVVNNGGDEETRLWGLQVDAGRTIVTNVYPAFPSLSGCWNHHLDFLFGKFSVDHVLVVNNDTEFREDTYERLLEHSKTAGREFVTAVSIDDYDKVMRGEVHEDRSGERPHPDFSCFLITKKCWNLVGKFDEHYLGCYREDQDYHRRMKLVGIEAVCIDVPFLHHASQTVKLDPEVAEEVAKLDEFRTNYYREKWGGLMAERDLHCSV